MRRFSIIVAVFFVLIALLFVSAFLYVDFSGHKGYLFDIYTGGKAAGTIRIDKFITEDKIIYKSHTELPGSLQYPVIDERMYLKRKTMVLQKFREESKDIKGRKRLIWLFQRGETIDFLFLEHPRVFSFQGFKTGENTMVYSPSSAMLYMPLIDEYNFWRKGSQFFEIMVPVREPILPMRTKMEMKYSRDAYVSVGGHKREAEVFILTGEGISKAQFVLSKYSHEILKIDLEGGKTQIILKNYLENPYERMRFIVDEVMGALKKIAQNKILKEEELLFEGLQNAEGGGKTVQIEEAVPQIEGKEVFFAKGDTSLSGKIWLPLEKGKYPGVILVPANSPVTGGCEKLTRSLGKSLAKAGFVVLSFGYSSKGTAGTALSGIDDKKAVESIKAAVFYLKSLPSVLDGNIFLAGHKGGGYLALRASSQEPLVSGNVILGIPPPSARTDVSGEFAKENLDKLLSLYGLGPFESTFSSLVAKSVAEYAKNIISSEKGYAFFKGVKLPTDEYRDFLKRKPYEEIAGYKRPLLFIYGRDDKRFDDRAQRIIAELANKKDKNLKIAEVRTSGEYMGGKSEEKTNEKFAIDTDILRVIISWLKEKTVLENIEKSGVE